MIVKRGIAVSHGVAIGPALVLGTESFQIPSRFVRVNAVESEIVRFRCALENVCREISTNEQLASQQIGEKYGAIFGAHLQLARDPKLIGEVESLIRTRHYSPEFAASQVLRRYAKELQNLGNHYFAERAADLFDLERSMLRHLLGEQREEVANLAEDVVVLAHDLTPSETATLDRKHVRGFVTEVGGSTSHTAILAGAFEIPAVVGVGHFLADVSGGDIVIIDGNHGEIVIAPDDETLERYRDSAERSRSLAQRLLSRGSRISKTKDRVRIEVFGNIEFPEEAEHCLERGADGIGLYRTEFLYLTTFSQRSEDDHYRAYRQVVETMGDRPVVIRTLDLGADKIPGAAVRAYKQRGNPELGLRSIRLSLDNLSLFKTQLRAVLRAATTGDVRVMFPMISSLMELRQAKMILRDVTEDLEDEGVDYRGDLPVGIMVEVPAVAMMAEEFAREVDFFSIGTNDLIQYTLAADRSDPAVAKYYNAADPAILRIVRRIVQAAVQADLPVTVCGQMSSDPKFVPLLVGMGLRQLSTTPLAIPEVKEVVRSLTIPQAEEILGRALEFELARDVEVFLRGELKKICPDLVE
ncbi:MAG: phosphoenolpyruvate--protein phosphotransferase [Planctomycetota bacterium]|nr:MAG: phosphoenolpyruvate--protein phosphotransferase [Planctomycetota bacterium]REJ95342.1 MAG: phosphoenolpyruvate--protein phosphotransferase [Planctomycetota bacterium]REK24214.1 MAG: phosphoenolpyruvate--protein phosphotransferase [Planctomycetota bacterium]REK28798.1 MAG: phosphoenolpyruvate--protein phosphotransferase [Planctomycetota bacterium]